MINIGITLLRVKSINRHFFCCSIQFCSLLCCFHPQAGKSQAIYFLYIRASFALKLKFSLEVTLFTCNFRGSAARIFVAVTTQRINSSLSRSRYSYDWISYSNSSFLFLYTYDCPLIHCANAHCVYYDHIYQKSVTFQALNFKVSISFCGLSAVFFQQSDSKIQHLIKITTHQAFFQ